MTSPAATRPLLLSPGETARLVGLSRACFYRVLRVDPALLRCRRFVPGMSTPRFYAADLERWASMGARARG